LLRVRRDAVPAGRRRSAGALARLARVARDGEYASTDRQCQPPGFVASAAPGLEAEVHANRFRSDLYRRLSASRIDVPQLRERPDDVAALATRVLDDWCAANGLAPRAFTQTALALLAALTWPGNVAELKSVVERAARIEPRGDSGRRRFQHSISIAPGSFHPKRSTA
jgi:DNA-binding NtrC family response regulator